VNVGYVHEEIRNSRIIVFAATSANGPEAKPYAGERPAVASREQKGTR